MADIEKLLVQQIKSDCPDLHLVTKEPPFFRLRNGKIRPLKNAKPLPKEEVERITVEIIGKDGLQKLREEKEVDFAIERSGLSRFRVTFYEETRGPAIAFRAIPLEIPKPEEIEIPETVLERVMRNEGLILITGPNGAGKSTTLASLVNFINGPRINHPVH